MWIERTIAIVSRVYVPTIIGLLAVGISPDLHALEKHKYQHQRALFAEVESELKRGNRRPFKRHSKILATYPLYPYLMYQDLRNRLPRAKKAEVEAFLERYGDNMPLADKLRHRWLGQLAQRGQWKDFLFHYKDSPTVINQENLCNRAYALIHAGYPRQAREAMEELWLVDFSQPPQCDPVFKYGFESGIITDDLVWQRILLVWGRDQRRLADYLGRKLRGAPRQWLGSLKQATSDPRRAVLNVGGDLSDSSYADDVMMFAMQRLINEDIVTAERLWHKLKWNCGDCQSSRELERTIGVAAAKRLMPQDAYRMLSNLPQKYHNRQSRHWRIRAALRTGDWRQALIALDGLEIEERDIEQWSYWRAHALAALGQRQQARTIWMRLADENSYYGYLSADQLNRDYPYALPRIRADADDMFLLVDSYPAVERIHELLILDRMVDANRELLPLTQRLGEVEQMRFAAIANRWQWPIGTVRGLAGSGLSQYLVESFPLPYRNLVRAEARRTQIPEEWIYGIIRRESIFVEDAKSSAGALGLMQLLPGTAREMASRLGMESPSTYGILSPPTNIRLGATYIKHLYQRNDDNLVFSLAGYNAGLTNVRRWLNTAPVSDIAVWVDTIPIEETRRYVRKVLFYTLVYRHLLGKPSTRLSQLMGGEDASFRLD